MSGFVFGSPTTWSIHEKKLSFTGDDFRIEDDAGNTVARAKGKVFSIRDRTTFTDERTGAEIFTTYFKQFSMSDTVYIERAGQVLATIRGDVCGCPPTFRCYRGEADFSWGNESDAPVLYEAEAKCCRNRSRTFFDASGEECASTHERRCNDLFCGTDEYDVECEPGVDCAMIWAMTIAIDNIIEAKQNNN
mmetsp:Transcript_871/g.2514  ORF Transcript_871/g.2514 Transcript_871/m.2514 type:complete len:191 (+) Transcript_871:81-653(+)